MLRQLWPYKDLNIYGVFILVCSRKTVNIFQPCDKIYIYIENYNNTSPQIMTSVIKVFDLYT